VNAAGNQAVFLSYASQDAEAAKRICEALRTADVEVWFDVDGGLEHGDEWDAKIRRQIRDCVLFIPIISANTQARHEGYFRIEWDLAAERARGIASGVAFILPVVIDDTRQPDALVPDRFRSVQWTRLAAGVVPPEVQARLLRLWSHRTGALKDEAARTEAGGDNGRVPEPAVTRRVRSRTMIFALVLGGVIAAGVGAFFLFKPRPGGGDGTQGARVPPIMAGNAIEHPATRAEDQALVAQAWDQMNKAELARAELDVADGLCKRATELDPNNAEAWAAWSQVDSWYIFHQLSNTRDRQDGARMKVARALQLAPNGFEPRLAQACYLVRGRGDVALSVYASEAERLLRGLLSERPDEPRALLALGILQRNLGHLNEAKATFGRLAQQPAFAALGWSELGWAELGAANAVAEAAADRSLAIQPFWGNRLLKGELLAEWHGDLEAAQRLWDQSPATVLEEDFGLAASFELAFWRRDATRFLRLAQSVPRDWLHSHAFDGPTGWWIGHAEQLAGHAEAAHVQWAAALNLVESRLVQSPSSGDLTAWKGALLAVLGERVESEKALRLAREMGVSGRGIDFRYAAALNGHVEEEFENFERWSAANPELSWAARARLSPWLDPLRTHPRFAELQARLDADPRSNPDAKKAVVDEKSIAVLAFDNLSDDKSNEYFSDGISEELLNVLAKIPGLKVCARTSAFYFKGKEVPIPEIAKQLGVAYVVEGSVRKQGDRVRITAQLIKAADGFHVWSETFTRELKDVFAVQDEIAGLVANNLSLKLGAGGGNSAAVNSDAFELYLQARAAWRLRTNESIHEAESLIRRAIELEPGFAHAHAVLAEVLEVRTQSRQPVGSRRSAECLEVIAVARHAVSLDPRLADAYTALGGALWNAWRLDEGRAALRQAISLNPSDATAWQWLGRVLLTDGQVEEALEALHRAVELDPLSSRIHDNYAICLLDAGRFQDALKACDRALALQPESLQALAVKGTVLAEMGRASEAKALSRALSSTSDFRDFAAYMLASAGVKDEAQALLSNSRLSPPKMGAELLLGRDGDVFAELRPDDMWVQSFDFLLFWPVFDPIRGDSRFIKLLERLGLTEAHARAQAWRAAHPREKTGVKL